MVRHYLQRGKEESLPTYLTTNERKLILELVNNARISDVDLANKLKISSQAVSKIRRKLENLKIIEKYSLELNYHKMDPSVFALFFIEFLDSTLSLEARDHFMEKSLFFHKIYLTNKSYLGLFHFKDLLDLRSEVDFIRQHYPMSISFKEIHVLHIEDIVKNCSRELSKKVIKEFNRDPQFLLPFLQRYKIERKREKAYSLSKNERLVVDSLLRNGRAGCRQISQSLSDISLSDRGIQKIISRLEERGIIKGYTVKLNYKKLGVGTPVIFLIKRKPHSLSFQEGFHKWIQKTPSITGCFHLGSTNQYLLMGHFKNFSSIEYYLTLIEKAYSDYLEVNRIIFLSHT